jgi:hypothetical protein
MHAINSKQDGEEIATVWTRGHSSRCARRTAQVRCPGSALLRERVKQCVSCPGRGAAFFTLLRRAGTHGYGSAMDPGSAAHRFALRSVRGTPTLILRSIAKRCVSKDGRESVRRIHPSRRAQERAPQDEVREKLHAKTSAVLPLRYTEQHSPGSGAIACDGLSAPPPRAITIITTLAPRRGPGRNLSRRMGVGVCHGFRIS